MSVNTRKIIIAALITGLFLILIFIPVSIIYKSGTKYLVTDKNGKIYRASNMFVCGDIIICMKSPDETNDKNDLAERGDFEYRLSIIDMKDLKLIEIITDEVIIENTAVTVDSRFTGKYHIQVQGHTGTLTLWLKDEKIYGSVRFPQWGKGATEYLKAVQINNGSISFTRSANSIKEINRLGANSYFTQRFSGRYSSAGKKINGFFINDRKEKYQWDASK